MADYIVTSGELTSVANAIREKNGTSSNLSWPDGFVSGISSGGETWNTVFEGNVTTEASGELSRGSFQGNISADNIKVTFNGTEYTCNRTGTPPDEMYRYGAPYSSDNDEYDFSEYPFCIEQGLVEGLWTVITQTAGTYTLKIEEPQGGGSSDFSTAEVTVTVTDENANITLPVVMSSPREGLGLQTLTYGTAHNGLVVNIGLYKGVTITIPTVGLGNLAVTGNAEISNGAVIITGDCTITIEGGLS